VKELLLDEDKLKKIGLRNYLESIKRNDWRSRINDMILALDVPQPEHLIKELAKLRDHSRNQVLGEGSESELTQEALSEVLADHSSDVAEKVGKVKSGMTALFIV